MKPVTLFSWGYYGWGNYTKQLVEAADAVEAKRGFNPPVFVDVRIRRMVRAPGFREKAFEKLLGPDRYRWMKLLGNQAVEDRVAGAIEIAEPKAAKELLEIAVQEANENNRRLIFFCGCQYPKQGKEITCHRAEVSKLVLAEAKKRKQPIEVVEWPGNEPSHIDVELPPKEFKAVVNCSKGKVALPPALDPMELSGLAWMSDATFQCGEEEVHRLVGPACCGPKGWSLPIMVFSEEDLPIEEYQKDAEKFRKYFGFNAVKK
jgi:hypothetical protein